MTKRTIHKKLKRYLSLIAASMTVVLAAQLAVAGFFKSLFKFIISIIISVVLSIIFPPSIATTLEIVMQAGKTLYKVTSKSSSKTKLAVDKEGSFVCSTYLKDPANQSLYSAECVDKGKALAENLCSQNSSARYLGDFALKELGNYQVATFEGGQQVRLDQNRSPASFKLEDSQFLEERLDNKLELYTQLYGAPTIEKLYEIKVYAECSKINPNQVVVKSTASAAPASGRISERALLNER